MHVNASVERARQLGDLPVGLAAVQLSPSLVAVMDGRQTRWLLVETFAMTAVFDAQLLSIRAHLDAGLEPGWTTDTVRRR